VRDSSVVGICAGWASLVTMAIESWTRATPTSSPPLPGLIRSRARTSPAVRAPPRSVVAASRVGDSSFYTGRIRLRRAGMAFRPVHFWYDSELDARASQSPAGEIDVQRPSERLGHRRPRRRSQVRVCRTSGIAVSRPGRHRTDKPFRIHPQLPGAGEGCGYGGIRRRCGGAMIKIPRLARMGSLQRSSCLG
jgi:hypothetical protein